MDKYDRREKDRQYFCAWVCLCFIHIFFLLFKETFPSFVFLALYRGELILITCYEKLSQRQPIV